MRNEHLMRIWFTNWNEDIRRSRESYDRREAGLARVSSLLSQGEIPEYCRSGLHKLTEATTRWEKGGWRCRPCHNEGQNRRYRKAHPIRKRRGPKMKLSHVKEKEVARKYKAGASIRMLEAEYGVSKPTILRAVRNSGVAVRSRVESARAAQPKGESPQLTAEQRDGIVARYKEDVSSSVIAAEFGIAPMTVLRVIRRAGVTARSRSESIKLSHASRRNRATGRTA